MLPQDLQPDRVSGLFNVYRSNVRALEHYRPKPYPGTIVLLQADRRAGRRTAYGGWRRLAAGGLDLRSVPGDHFSLVKEPDVKTVAAEIRAYLDEVES